MAPVNPGRTATLAAGALVLNAFVWGVSWWPFRHLQGHGLHPLWATALMYLLIVAGLLTVQFKAWRGFVAYPQLFLLGIAAGLTNVGFNWAVTVGDVVRVVLLFYLMPAWSVLVAWLLLGEKPTPASLLRLLLAMTGVLIVLKSPDSAWPLPQGAADWLALFGGLSFAVTNSMLRKYGHTPSASRMLAMFGGSGLLAAATALVGMSVQGVPAPALQAAGIPVLLGLSLAFMASNAALQYGAARLAAGTTAIVMLTEILFASLSSAALGAAEFTPRIVLGGSLIVLAAVLAAMTPGAESAGNDAKSA
jgi:drug/metabolite transporter (DMT)-like permease